MYKLLQLSFVSVAPEAQYSSICIAMLLEHVEESKKGFMSTNLVTMLHVCPRHLIFYVLQYVVLHTFFTDGCHSSITREIIQSKGFTDYEKKTGRESSVKM
jgi:hypothetical protein